MKKIWTKPDKNTVSVFLVLKNFESGTLRTWRLLDAPASEAMEGD